MGGSGSGRPGWHSKVEDCRWLDVNRWMREGILKADLWSCGGWKWVEPTTGEERSSIGYEVDTTDPSFPWVRLHYRLTRTNEDVDYKILLQTTRPHIAGIRWWFTCPLVVENRPCNRRVAKLYLPPGGRYFGCRHCYHLTYESCQESHKFDGVFALLAGDFPGIPPIEVRKLLTRKKK